MLEKFVRLMVWWFRRWYPVFRFVGRVTGREEFVKTAIETSEENIEHIQAALEDDE
jgi:ABC-type Fe3+-hydroxamate transport system substrate-binding protein